MRNIPSEPLLSMLYGATGDTDCTRTLPLPAALCRRLRCVDVVPDLYVPLLSPAVVQPLVHVLASALVGVLNHGIVVQAAPHLLVDAVDGAELAALHTAVRQWLVAGLDGVALEHALEQLLSDIGPSGVHTLLGMRRTRGSVLQLPPPLRHVLHSSDACIDTLQHVLGCL